MPQTHSSRNRTRDRASRYSPAPSKPPSPSDKIDPTTRIIPEATEEVGSKYGRYNYMNFPPTHKVWRADDITAIAAAVHEARDITPPSLTSSSADVELPAKLARKTRDNVRGMLQHLQKTFDDAHAPFVLKCSVPNFQAVLAAEILFMHTHAHERNLALYKLVQSRNMLTGVQNSRSSFLRDLKRLTAQVDKERVRRTRAQQLKAKHDGAQSEVREVLEHIGPSIANLQTALEKARMNDLEVRRRLDKIQLKVGALRGEMVVPTVNELDVKVARRHNGPDGDPVGSREMHSAIAKFGATDASRELSGDNSSSASSMSTDSLDETDMETDEEGVEYRLLKNRLCMVEEEAGEWKGMWNAERTRVQLVSKAKVQLEEEIARVKQGGGSKASNGTGGRASAKVDHRSHAKIRSAVRASISVMPTEMSPRKMIRRGRKSRKPTRSLVPDPCDP